MSRYKLLKISIEIVMPHDKITEDTMNQIQDFMLDEYVVEDLRWDHFDLKALRMHIEEEHNNVEFDDDERQPEMPKIRNLDLAES
jgi:hypothetical protein